MNGLSIKTLENINKYKHVTKFEQIIEFFFEANGMIIGNI